MDAGISQLFPNNGSINNRKFNKVSNQVEFRRNLINNETGLANVTYELQYPNMQNTAFENKLQLTKRRFQQQIPQNRAINQKTVYPNNYTYQVPFSNRDYYSGNIRSHGNQHFNNQKSHPRIANNKTNYPQSVNSNSVNNYVKNNGTNSSLPKFNENHKMNQNKASSDHMNNKQYNTRQRIQITTQMNLNLANQHQNMRTNSLTSLGRKVQHNNHSSQQGRNKLPNQYPDFSTQHFNAGGCSNLNDNPASVMMSTTNPQPEAVVIIPHIQVSDYPISTIVSDEGSSGSFTSKSSVLSSGRSDSLDSINFNSTCTSISKSDFNQVKSPLRNEVITLNKIDNDQRETILQKSKEIKQKEDLLKAKELELKKREESIESLMKAKNKKIDALIDSREEEIEFEVKQKELEFEMKYQEQRKLFEDIIKHKEEELEQKYNVYVQSDPPINKLQEQRTLSMKTNTESNKVIESRDLKPNLEITPLSNNESDISVEKLSIKKNFVTSSTVDFHKQEIPMNLSTFIETVNNNPITTSCSTTNIEIDNTFVGKSNKQHNRITNSDNLLKLKELNIKSRISNTDGNIDCTTSESKKVLRLLEDNQKMTNEISLISQALAESIGREVNLENKMQNLLISNLNLSEDMISESVEVELRQKSKTIIELINKLNEERIKRYLAEEKVMKITPSTK